MQGDTQDERRVPATHPPKRVFTRRLCQGVVMHSQRGGGGGGGGGMLETTVNRQQL